MIIFLFWGVNKRFCHSFCGCCCVLQENFHYSKYAKNSPGICEGFAVSLSNLMSLTFTFGTGEGGGGGNNLQLWGSQESRRLSNDIWKELYENIGLKSLSLPLYPCYTQFSMVLFYKHSLKLCVKKKIQDPWFRKTDHKSGKKLCANIFRSRGLKINQLITAPKDGFFFGFSENKIPDLERFYSKTWLRPRGSSKRYLEIQLNQFSRFLVIKFNTNKQKKILALKKGFLFSILHVCKGC